MDARPVELVRRDGYRLHGRWWSGGGHDVVVVACATGAQASYYGRYAAWLAGNGRSCLTLDYRGIGESREPGLRDRATRCYQWGSLDIDAAPARALEQAPGARMGVVGHSFGGLGVTFAPYARHVHRLLTVGARHARWTDCRAGHRRSFPWRWHDILPLTTLARGHSRAGGWAGSRTSPRGPPSTGPAAPGTSSAPRVPSARGSPRSSGRSPPRCRP